MTVFKICGCAGSSLLGTSFSLVAARGLLSGPEALAPCCAGLSGCRAQGQGVWAREVAAGLQSAGSVVVALGPHCSACVWDLPGPEIEPQSPALAGGFFTAKPPGKPCT